jgi:hypothetical protein
VESLRLEFLLAAAEEAFEAAHWYHQRSEDAALAFLKEVRFPIRRRVSDFPGPNSRRRHSPLQQTTRVLAGPLSERAALFAALEPSPEVHGSGRTYWRQPNARPQNPPASPGAGLVH